MMQAELLDTGSLTRSIEAILFVASEALSIKTLAKLTGAEEAEVSVALARIDARAAFLILFLGICGGAIGYFLWTLALAHLTPTQVAVYVNLNPMVAAALGAALLAEKLTPVFIVCFIAVITGVLLVNWPAKAAAKS